MATISIPYGKSIQNLNVPDERLRAVLRPNHNSSDTADEATLVQNALEHPINSPRLCELSRQKQRILLITSDHTRPVPSHITLPLLLAEIRRENTAAEITILVATGMHRLTTEEELRDKFGDKIVDSESIVVHEAAKNEDMVFFGILPSGGELWLNRLVEEADLVVAEGFIEPHFFAGFSGGRKSILPGVASKKTVLYNHNARFISDPMARQGSVNENPIHRDMVWAAKQAKLAFILNIILDENKRITAAFAGDQEQAHLTGCAQCERNSRVLPVAADIVVTSNGGYPLDQNVYQSVKGMTAAEACVREGGIIIFCAALGDGHGGEAFYRWFADRDNAEQVRRDIDHIAPENTVMDQWEAQILARVLCKADCIFVTENENRKLIEQMHMRWASDVNVAFTQATALLGHDYDVTVIPDGVGVIVG